MTFLSWFRHKHVVASSQGRPRVRFSTGKRVFVRTVTATVSWLFKQLFKHFHSCVSTNEIDLYFSFFIGPGFMLRWCFFSLYREPPTVAKISS